MNLTDWRKSGGHLPDFLKDFHDQKDFFKLMHRLYGPFQHNNESVSWIAGQCYVIDYFLWFCALHGYTIQKCKAKKDFENLTEKIKAMKDEQARIFFEMLNDHTSSSSSSS